jgi:hypothetical protein
MLGTRALGSLPSAVQNVSASSDLIRGLLAQPSGSSCAWMTRESCRLVTQCQAFFRPCQLTSPQRRLRSRRACLTLCSKGGFGSQQQLAVVEAGSARLLLAPPSQLLSLLWQQLICLTQSSSQPLCSSWQKGITRSQGALAPSWVSAQKARLLPWSAAPTLATPTCSWLRNSSLLARCIKQRNTVWTRTRSSPIGSVARQLTRTVAARVRHSSAAAPARLRLQHAV